MDNYKYGKNRVLIKKKKEKKKHVFRRSFLKDGQTRNSCHSQHDVSFVIRTLKNFNFFGPGFALLYALFLSKSWDFIF